jgi:hypothetical protein
MKILFFTAVVLFSLAAGQVEAVSLDKTVAGINADAKKPGGPERVLKSVAASTHVPEATLEKEKAKSGMTYGDLFAAHTVAKASGKTFDQIAAIKAKGGNWDKVAADSGVSSGDKKAANKPEAKPSPTPAQKTLRQEQIDRYKN